MNPHADATGDELRGRAVEQNVSLEDNDPVDVLGNGRELM
jgi:hypothetical protein